MHLHINVKLDAIALICYQTAMKPEPDKKTISAWARLMKAQQKALDFIESRLRDAKLPPLSWYDVLLELERPPDGRLRPFELERQMLLAQYNLSRLIDRIENAGYVERQPCQDDARGQTIVITQSGKKLRRRMWPVYAQAIQVAVGDRLTKSEIEMLEQVLKKLAD